MNKKAEQRYVVLGEHFYQPLRRGSHPRVSEIQTDPQGVNWNQVISEECYVPQTQQGTLKYVSFDFFPTIRREMMDIAPNEAETLKLAMKESGVGDSFLHVLLPDLSKRDKFILVRAGYAAFIEDTGVSPQWFWAAETALDYETLEVLKSVGYKGVICAPEQIEGIGTYPDNVPVRIGLRKGQTILALPFDRPFSSTMAFADKSNADKYAHSTVLPRVERLSESLPLIGWTDGETFGHHAPMADIFLNYLVTESLPSAGVAMLGINNLPDVWEESDYKIGYLRERTAWSCPHGDLIRWHGACPCDGGKHGGWKEHFSNAIASINTQMDTLLDSELGAKWASQLSSNFEKYLYYKGSKNTKKSLFAAKASILAGMISCGTFFESPLTSGNINMLFVQQAFEHLKDAGFEELVIKMQVDFTKTLEKGIDPYSKKDLTQVLNLVSA